MNTWKCVHTDIFTPAEYSCDTKLSILQLGFTFFLSKNFEAVLARADRSAPGRVLITAVDVWACICFVITRSAPTRSK